MKFLDKKTLKIDRVETELDRFVADFISILGKHAKYVIVSGYVAILLGRSRATEGIDILIGMLDKARFIILFSELDKAGYDCFNAEGAADAFDCLSNNIALRFSKKARPIPNIELKFVKTQFDRDTLKDKINVVMPFGSIFVSELEKQIAFKRYVLKSDKDMEDAAHIELVLKGKIDSKKIEKYKNELGGQHA